MQSQFTSLLIIAVALTGSLTIAQSTNSTAAPTTSTAAPTTSTAAPTTSTAAPTNSTAAPTTSTVAPTNSTAVPTTTKAPATTTPAAPAAPTNTYNVTDGKVVCIRMQAAISLDIQYLKKDNTNGTVTVAVPKAATFGGECGNDTQTLNLAFFDKDAWKVSFEFVKESSSSYNVAFVNITYVIDSHFPDAKNLDKTMTVSLAAKKDFMKANNNGYTCVAQQKLSEGDVTVKTKELKLKAFNEDDKADFTSGALECSADDDTNSIVPIAVGAALAGLVVIVLIAYLIGRKRTRKTGYESV